MFDEYERSRPQLSITPPVITIACGGGGAILSFGLCGIGGLIRGSRLPVLSTVALFLFGLSVLAMIVGFLWLVVVAIVNSTRKTPR